MSVFIRGRFPSGCSPSHQRTSNSGYAGYSSVCTPTSNGRGRFDSISSPVIIQDNFQPRVSTVARSRTATSFDCSEQTQSSTMLPVQLKRVSFAAMPSSSGSSMQTPLASGTPTPVAVGMSPMSRAFQSTTVISPPEPRRMYCESVESMLPAPHGAYRPSSPVYNISNRFGFGI
eukprot:gnl/MRDRNA2_/MRDRNA2_163018_c0_seq1.p1 gnl/MRDRNA2_/MRDRNA2_163018_c0~~gnl/MRDRNA2_/MRDRNA2_163018_c0_seq1.p1  ORF type:complete len:201 (+),score=7.37 gnl/MRDRNA2_/MRDRNA2_163018_c0_seq1:83-604(+)